MTARRPAVRVGGRWGVLSAGDSLAGIPGGVQAVFDGGGGVVAVGAYCDIRVPYAFLLNKVTVLADVAGSLVVDVRVGSFAAYPPTGADSIVAAAPPSLAGTNKSEDTALTGWTKQVAAGAVMRFVVTACSGIGRATLILEGVRN